MYFDKVKKLFLAQLACCLGVFVCYGVTIAGPLPGFNGESVGNIGSTGAQASITYSVYQNEHQGGNDPFGLDAHTVPGINPVTLTWLPGAASPPFNSNAEFLYLYQVRLNNSITTLIKSVIFQPYKNKVTSWGWFDQSSFVGRGPLVAQGCPLTTAFNCVDINEVGFPIHNFLDPFNAISVRTQLYAHDSASYLFGFTSNSAPTWKNALACSTDECTSSSILARMTRIPSVGPEPATEFRTDQFYIRNLGTTQECNTVPPITCIDRPDAGITGSIKYIDPNPGIDDILGVNDLRMIEIIVNGPGHNDFTLSQIGPPFHDITTNIIEQGNTIHLDLNAILDHPPSGPIPTLSIHSDDTWSLDNGHGEGLFGRLAFDSEPCAGKSPCDGGVCTVSVGDSSITYHTDSAPGITLDGFGFRNKTPGGLLTWNVRGVNRSFAQQSFYRLGNESHETSFVPEINPDFDNVTSCYDLTAAKIYVIYDGVITPIKVYITYSLLGKIPGRESLVLRDVEVTNKTVSPIALTWFDYSDFDVSGVQSSDDRIQSHLHAGSTRVITQSGGGYSVVSQWPLTVQDDSFIHGQPVAFQIAPWGSNPRGDNILANLLDNSITNLTSVPDILTFQNDFVHAVQFSFSGVTDNVGMRMSSILMLIGDIDGDGDVDLDDLNMVIAARNQPVKSADDPRDLDGDGKITALDARKLILLCTRPRCATQ